MSFFNVLKGCKAGVYKIIYDFKMSFSFKIKVLIPPDF
jgi:hypothetical protein